MTNRDLAELVDDTIKSTGTTKTFISNKLGISRQALDKLLDKKQFSIDDANRILNILGFYIDKTIIKKL